MSGLGCISSMATRLLLAGLCEDWRKSGGQAVTLESVGGVDAAKRVEAGEAFDVVVLASDALEKLAAAGHVVASSMAPIALSGVAIAASAEGAPPVVSTRDDLLAALRSARCIGYSTGPSGRSLLALLESWDVLAELQPKMLQAPAGVAVGELIAQGKMDLGFQQLSELIHCKGIALLGPMPEGAGIDTMFSAAVCSKAASPEQAAAFIDFLRSPRADEAKRREGMAPA